MLPNLMSVDANLSQYLRVREAAAFLGVHPDTLRRWEQTGKLSTYRHPVNRYRLYKKPDLEALLREVRGT